jgi:hypothetical protein
MKPNLFLIAITLLNAGILTVSFIQNRSPVLTPAADQILRGRGLQIVDDSGNVRASIQIMPQSRQQDGTMSAETVLLRLITERGRPAVKISTSEQQSGMSLTGPTGTSHTYVQALAGSSASAVVVRSEDGGERRIEP